MSDEPIQEIPIPIRRYSPNGETAKKVSLIVTLASLVFTAGYNWRRIDETTTAVATVSATQEKFVKEVTENYVRRDVQEQQLRNIDARLQEIRDLMQRLEESRRREAR